LAGNTVSEHAKAMLEFLNVKINPQYIVSKKLPVDAGSAASFTPKDCPNATESFQKLSAMVQLFLFSTMECLLIFQQRVLNEFKETVCHVSEYPYHEQ
jgi:hypothetical protein